MGIALLVTGLALVFVGLLNLLPPTGAATEEQFKSCRRENHDLEDRLNKSDGDNLARDRRISQLRRDLDADLAKRTEDYQLWRADLEALKARVGVIEELLKGIRQCKCDQSTVEATSNAVEKLQVEVEKGGGLLEQMRVLEERFAKFQGGQRNWDAAEDGRIVGLSKRFGLLEKQVAELLPKPCGTKKSATKKK